MDILNIDIHREHSGDGSVESVSDAIDEPEPSDQQLRNWTRKAYLQESAAEVSLALVSTQTIAQLNAQYRGKSKPTNVLSFPAELDIPQDTPTQAVALLGDIVFCPTVIDQEAHEQNKSVDHHWAHMCIHGMLHLQGYDHIEQQDAEVMEALEIKMLASLDIPNPYLTN